MIPDEMIKKEQWVCCREDSKIPFKAWEYDPASTTDSKTWSDFWTAQAAVVEGYYSSLGYVFDGDYVGIDIDTGLDEYGLINDLSLDIINACKSYCEESRSGRGFHIILKGTLPFTGANNREGVEIYTSGRFFVMTGKTLFFDEIIENQEAIDYIVDKYFTIPDVSEKLKCRLIISDNIYQPIWQDVFRDGRIKIKPYLPPITEGGRNISLLSFGGSLVSTGYTNEQILYLMRECNKECCKPPLTDSEVNQIYKSVLKYKRKGRVYDEGRI